MRDQHYSDSTLDSHLAGLGKVGVWLGRRRITTLAQLTQKDLQVAHDHFLPNQKKAASVISALMRFLSEHQLVSPGTSSPAFSCGGGSQTLRCVSARDSGCGGDDDCVAVGAISEHSCGFSDLTATQLLCSNSNSVRWKPSSENRSQTNNRSSIQQGCRGGSGLILKERHAQGVAVSIVCICKSILPGCIVENGCRELFPWARIQALIQSIDRSEPMGRRDFTLLYLAAAYGLRSGELVRLTLDSIDWGNRVLRVRQAKTRQMLQLPLTDEAANVLIEYLRQARPESARRELFLRSRAPCIPLAPTSVNAALERHIRRSGVDLPRFSPHVLRHSFATWLMHQGVGLKAIGDALGHRSIASTSVYLRLNVDELRQVALPVPVAPAGGSAISLCSRKSLPRIRPAHSPHKISGTPSESFCSVNAAIRGT